MILASCRALSETSCPIEIDAFESADQRASGRKMPGFSPGRSTPVGLPDAERRGSLEETARPEAQPDADDSDVRGMLEDARQRQRAVVVVVGLADRRVGDADRAVARCR